MDQPRQPWIEMGVSATAGAHVSGVHQQLVQQAPAPIWIPDQAPRPPEYFVERPQIVNKLLEHVLTEAGATTVITAILGLPGVGKSTAAMWLAHQPSVRSRFPDGVLWATLGQRPRCESILAAWIRELGDYNWDQNLPLESASSHLRTLLEGRRMLVVIDDVWHPEHADALALRTAGSCFVITTREKVIADFLRVEPRYLDLMTSDECLALLAGRLGQPFSAIEEKHARTIATLLGYLPLALELAAGHIADGISWADLARRLRETISRLRDLRKPEADYVHDEKALKKLCLRACFEQSIRLLTSADRERFAMLGALPEDVVLTAPMMCNIWALGRDDIPAARILRVFHSKALLMLADKLDDGRPTYRIHDLLHEYCIEFIQTPIQPSQERDLPGLGLDLAEVHRKIAGRYATLTDGGQWHTLPNDGYIYDHILFHMQASGQCRQMHDLLGAEDHKGRNAWYERRHALGQIAGYVGDVERARRSLINADVESTDNLSLSARYALIRASLNSISHNLYPEILRELVRRQLWPFQQAIAYGHLNPDPILRAAIYRLLCPLASHGMLGEIVAATRSIDDPYSRVAILVEVVRRASGTARCELYSVLLTTSCSEENVGKRYDLIFNSLRVVEPSCREPFIAAARDVLTQMPSSANVSRAQRQLENLECGEQSIPDDVHGLLSFVWSFDSDSRLQSALGGTDIPRAEADEQMGDRHFSECWDPNGELSSLEIYLGDNGWDDSTQSELRTDEEIWGTDEIDDNSDASTEYDNLPEEDFYEDFYEEKYGDYAGLRLFADRVKRINTHAELAEVLKSVEEFAGAVQLKAWEFIARNAPQDLLMDLVRAVLFSFEDRVRVLGIRLIVGYISDSQLMRLVRGNATIGDAYEYTLALAALARVSSGDVRDRLLDFAERAVHLIGDGLSAAKALAIISSMFPTRKREDLFQEALSRCRSASGETDTADGDVSSSRVRSRADGRISLESTGETIRTLAIHCDASQLDELMRLMNDLSLVDITLLMPYFIDVIPLDYQPMLLDLIEAAAAEEMADEDALCELIPHLNDEGLLRLIAINFQGDTILQVRILEEVIAYGSSPVLKEVRRRLNMLLSESDRRELRNLLASARSRLRKSDNEHTPLEKIAIGTMGHTIVSRKASPAKVGTWLHVLDTSKSDRPGLLRIIVDVTSESADAECSEIAEAIGSAVIDSRGWWP